MANTLSNATSDLPERKLMDLISHGDDFMKIELFRPALSYYRRALDLNPGNKVIGRNIEECKRLLVVEIKAIRILVAIAAVIISLYLLL